MFVFDSHFPAGSASCLIHPTSVYSIVSCTHCYLVCRIHNGRDALRPTVKDGASSYYPRQAAMDRTSTRPNTPTQDAAVQQWQGFMQPVPARLTVENSFLNASITSTSSVGSSWSNVAIAPSKSAPRPSDLSPQSSRACLHRVPHAFCCPYHLGYTVPPTNRGNILPCAR